MTAQMPSPPPGSFAKLMATQPKKDVRAKSPTPEPKVVKKTTDQKVKKRVHTSVHTRKHVSMHAYMCSVIDEKATNSFAFRYPPDILNKVEEILHQVWGKYRVKLTKNSIAVTAMAYLLWDFEENGKESILYKMLINRSK